MANSTYLAPTVCFACRKSFKRRVDLDPASCPDCDGPTTQLSRNFKAPKRTDWPQWDKVEFLVDNGFLFQTVTDPSTCEKVPYPSTLQDARDFVETYRNQAIIR